MIAEAATEPRAMPGRVVDPAHPWAGLQPFGEDDYDFFHGRDEARDGLLRLVRREVLTVLFGRSGLGKTSLINAGLGPVLRREYILPIPVRLDFSARGGGFVAQVKTAIRKVLDVEALDASRPEEAETLWEYFHRAQVWNPKNRLLTPLLVFDPFEEIFSLGAGDDRIEPLVTELADLIENQIPSAVREHQSSTGDELPFSYEKQRVRVLFSLREDFLAQLEDLSPRIPSLARNRFRLLPMNGEQALAAVLGPGGGLVTREVAEEIVRFVAGAGQKESPGPSPQLDLDRLEVEPALLSLICRELNDRRLKLDLPTITSDLLTDARGEILSSFYLRCLADLGAPVREFVEERLLTSSGFRRSESWDEALRTPGVTGKAISTLVDRRLLRLDERFGRTHIELIHDRLTEVVGDSRRRRREWQARRRLLRRMIAAVAVLMLMVILASGLAVRENRLNQEAQRERTLAENERTRALRERQRAISERSRAEGERQHAEKERALAEGERQHAEREWLRGESERARAEGERKRAEKERKRTAGERARAETLITFILYDFRDHLEELEQAKGLNKEIQAKALEYYDSLPRQGESDETALNRAVTYNNNGVAAIRMKSRTEALRFFNRGLEIFTRLASRRPSDIELQHDLFISQEDIATVLVALGETGDSLDHYSAAVRLAEQLLPNAPRNPILRRDLLGICSKLGGVLLTLGQPARALEHYNRALEIIEQTVQAEPGDKDLQRSRYLVLRQIGNAHFEQGDVTAAVADYSRALAIAEKLGDLHPTKPTYRQDLIGFNQSLCRALADLGQADDAVTACAAARRMLTELTAMDPKDTSLQNSLSWNHVLMGLAYVAHGDHEHATTEWTQAAEIIAPVTAEDDDSSVLDTEARALLLLGRKEQARTDVEKLVKRGWNMRGFRDLVKANGLETDPQRPVAIERPASGNSLRERG